MARQILLDYQGATSRFDIAKVDRAKLYGRRRRLPTDPDDKLCCRADLTSDGRTLLRRGMTAQGYFDEEGHWVPNKELVGLDVEGKAVDKAPSTLGVEQPLTGPVPATELLDLRVAAVYALDVQELADGLQAELDGGAVFRFDFNYRADWRMEHGFLVANDEGVFALVGQVVDPVWCELEQAGTPAEDDDDEADLDDELDFEMF